MADELFEIVKRYIFLEMINPRCELLKYFVWDESGFERNRDLAVSEEFLERFRGDIPTIHEIFQKKIRISFEEYQKKLYSSLFKNYISALESAIDFAKMMN
jgi:hypothetical protein